MESRGSESRIDNFLGKLNTQLDEFDLMYNLKSSLDKI